MTDTNRRLLIETAEAKRLMAEIAEMIGEDDALKLDMVEGETNLFEAVDRALARIQTVRAMQKGIAEQQEVLGLRKKRLASQEERLTASLGLVLEALAERSMERPIATIGMRATPRPVIVTDITLLPARFVKQAEPEARKAEIAKALKAGEVVEGATLGNGGTTLAIRFA